MQLWQCLYSVWGFGRGGHRGSIPLQPGSTPGALALTELELGILGHLHPDIHSATVASCSWSLKKEKSGSLAGFYATLRPRLNQALQSTGRVQGCAILSPKLDPLLCSAFV